MPAACCSVRRVSDSCGRPQQDVGGGQATERTAAPAAAKRFVPAACKHTGCSVLQPSFCSPYRCAAGRTPQTRRNSPLARELVNPPRAHPRNVRGPASVRRRNHGQCRGPCQRTCFVSPDSNLPPAAGCATAACVARPSTPSAHACSLVGAIIHRLSDGSKLGCCAVVSKASRQCAARRKTNHSRTSDEPLSRCG